MNTADNSANIPEVPAHALSAHMNTICQKEIRRVAGKPTVILPENMTTRGSPVQVGINAPDRAEMLMSHPGKGDKLANDDDMT